MEGGGIEGWRVRGDEGVLSHVSKPLSSFRMFKTNFKHYILKLLKKCKLSSWGGGSVACSQVDYFYL